MEDKNMAENIPRIDEYKRWVKDKNKPEPIKNRSSGPGKPYQSS